MAPGTTRAIGIFANWACVVSLTLRKSEFVAASAAICYASISHGYYKIRYKLIIVVIRITLRITQHAGVAESIVTSNVKMPVYPKTGIGILNQIAALAAIECKADILLLFS